MDNNNFYIKYANKNSLKDDDYYYILNNYLSKLRLNFTNKDIDKIIIFLNEIFNYNNYVNLVGNKEKEEIFFRHIIDCISIFNLTDYFNQEILKEKNIIDVGTGAGLPGVLLSILLKDSKIFLLEKSKKKVNFLKDITKKLELSNIDIINFSAEDILKEKKFREFFDIVTARAVTKINILLELVIPFSKINGKIFLYKSRKVYQEAIEYNKLIKKMGCNISKIEEINIPYLDEFRAILIIEKIRKTPKIFPRNLSVIKKSEIYY